MSNIHDFTVVFSQPPVKEGEASSNFLGDNLIPFNFHQQLMPLTLNNILIQDRLLAWEGSLLIAI